MTETTEYMELITYAIIYTLTTLTTCCGNILLLVFKFPQDHILMILTPLATSILISIILFNYFKKLVQHNNVAISISFIVSAIIAYIFSMITTIILRNNMKIYVTIIVFILPIFASIFGLEYCIIQ